MKLTLNTLGHSISITNFRSVNFYKNFEFLVVCFTDLNDAKEAKDFLQKDVFNFSDVTLDEQYQELIIKLKNVTSIMVE